MKTLACVERRTFLKVGGGAGLLASFGGLEGSLAAQQGMAPEDAVTWAEGELKKIYET